MANIKVAVRVRPISARELNLTGSDVVVRTDSNEISLTNLKVSSSKAGDSRERTRRYGFDYCFDSSDPAAENYADQAKIYETLGQTVLDAVFSGYNSCLVAYGQSASGKTYTMMGNKDEPGLTPRLCEGLFSRMENERKNERTFHVSVSYLEIYNERVRDLLKPSAGTSGLRVREHPRLGPYVQGLTQHLVPTLGALMSLVEEGSRARRTASTLQNPSSSRSHALLTVALAEDTGRPDARPDARAPAGKLRLVDLAGSESAAACGGVHRLKEGANINKSLVALGNVISALAERGSTGSGPGRRFIPYRDSSLTWLLKDALGGNATTIMLATISPASGSYNETAHTLRFAQRAQSVVNRPVVNEDPVARIIRELRAEVARLKSLLHEKNIEPENRSCCCKNTSENFADPDTIDPNPEDHRDTKPADKDRAKFDHEIKERSIASIRRSNSIDTITCESIKRFNSCDLSRNYNRAKVTELDDEEDEVAESVFVDIPTLVAVLIKPDDSQESSSRIEEISDEVADSIDFIETVESEIFELKPDLDEGSVNSCNDIDLFETCEPSIPQTKRDQFRKQDSLDVVSLPTNLHTSKRFGSVETIRKKEPFLGLERSHTNIEKRPTADRKKLNNIREIEDQKVAGRINNIWRETGKELQRKGSNDSDKSLKDSNLSKPKNYVRKPSLENLKRKTSKDSSSSSSKDEQILISSLTRDKLLRRKSSLEQEPSIRSHTPIQRAKRAEIVAAVTERLYSSRKHTEDSGIRSPPEGTEVKHTSMFSTKSKLQEISRKMLGKRRRVCVDTQTESSHTVRMKDTASETETPEIIRQDVAVLTDNHEICETVDHRVPVLRVKETATLTDKPKASIVKCKDVGSLANDLDEYDYEIHSPRNDSGILSDDPQNYAESNISSAESSTNTAVFSCRSFAVQTQDNNQPKPQDKTPVCVRQCSVQESPSLPMNTEKNVISISLPDMISITIESTNVLESRIAVMDSVDSPEEKVKSRTKDMEAQTDKMNFNETESRFCFKDFTRSTLSQTDGRVFRIENIFQDPNNVSRSCSQINVTSDQTEKRIRNSVIFTNSLGTSYAPDSKESVANAEEKKGEDICRGSFVKEGLITEAFITRKRSFNVSPGRRPQSIIYNDPWKNWMISCPINSMQSNCKRDVGVLPTSWQSHNSEMTGLTLSCTNCAASISMDQKFGPAHVEPKLLNIKEMSELNSTFSRLETGNIIDHDHNFSDDSLDYNESNISTESLLKMKNNDENRENLCPPDVVAHTKKETKSSNSDPENIESVVMNEFEDSHVEFPKKKPNEPTNDVPIHDYKSLILGKPSYNVYEIDEVSENSRANNSGKKKVSFSSINVENKPDQKRLTTNPTLKSIIKKKKKKCSDTPNANQSSNEDTDDSLQDKCSLTSDDCTESNWPGKLSSDSSDPNSKDSHRMKFPVSETCSSDSCETEDEGPSARNILEEYLDEAVIFMRNMNSINEYMSATRMFDKYLGRNGSRKGWKQDYVEYRGRKVSLRDDTDEYLEDDDIVVSTESYDRCLKGIQRLENCIKKVDRQNELLREKYGIDCESAGARLRLASPSIDPGTDPSDLNSEDFTNGNSMDDGNSEDDLEKRIFDQLMKAADTSCWNARKARQGRFSKLSDIRSRSPTTYSKFREKFNAGRILNSDESASTNLTRSNGNLRRFDDDLDSFDEDLRISNVVQSRPTSRERIYGDTSLMKPDDQLGKVNLTSNFPTRRNKEGSKTLFLDIDTASDSVANTSSADKIALFRDKLKYPGSPRARFLELLRERRRIVESSRGTSAS